MKKFPIAVQVYSVRNEASEDLDATLAKIKEYGYDGVEFAGLYGKTAEEVKALVDKYGLTPISAHVSYGELAKDPYGVLSTYAKIGCKYVAIPSINSALIGANPTFEFTVEIIGTIARAAKKVGIQLLYHNHDFEFTKYSGKYALDMIYDAVPADLLKTELDLCWVKVGGEDPAAYLRKYTGRAPVVHFKDYFGEKTDDMYELIGVETVKPKRPQGFEYRPMGMGLQDVPSLIAAAEDAGCEWIVIEQDSPSMGMTPLESIEKGIKNLRSFGL